jgi:hypothetical protein
MANQDFSRRLSFFDKKNRIFPLALKLRLFCQIRDRFCCFVKQPLEIVLTLPCSRELTFTSHYSEYHLRIKLLSAMQQKLFEVPKEIFEQKIVTLLSVVKSKPSFFIK